MTATRHRQSGSLQSWTRTARGRQYTSWRWRTHRPTDTGWTTVDTVLGEFPVCLRTRVLISLGELPPAPVFLERWARQAFSHIEELPAFTGQRRGSHQRAAWWFELPRAAGDSVRLRFRSLESHGYDFRWRFHREHVQWAEEQATSAWRTLSVDPLVRLAEFQWLAEECGRQAERTSGLIAELRQLRRHGEIEQDSFEQQERDFLAGEDRWHCHRSDLETAYDEQLAAAIGSLPRTRRDELTPRIHLRVERALQSPQQRAAWQSEHWSDGVLSWSVPS